MPQRTLAEARRQLEDLLPTLSDYARTQVEERLAEVEREARQNVERMLAQRMERLNTRRVAALQELCTIRDRLGELAKLGETGQYTAAAYTAELADLERRKRRAEAEVEAVARALPELERMEDDPLGYADERLYTIYPSLRPEFDW